MSNSEISVERRRLLQSASIGGLALLVAGCSEGLSDKSVDTISDDEFCSLPGKSGQPSEKELDEVASELWARFDQGTLVATKSGAMTLAPGLKVDREAFHRARVKDNWSKVTRCRRLTGQCAFNAGVVSALIAQAKGESTISKDTFLTAAEAAFEMQRNRAGSVTQFMGIAC